MGADAVSSSAGSFALVVLTICQIWSVYLAAGTSTPFGASFRENMYPAVWAPPQPPRPLLHPPGCLWLQPWVYLILMRQALGMKSSWTLKISHDCEGLRSYRLGRLPSEICSVKEH